MSIRPTAGPAARRLSPPALAVLLAALVVGGVLRLTYAFGGGLWRDEAQAIGIAEIPALRAMFEFLIHHESHPPLYHLLLRWWISLFGSSDASALTLPLLFGLALIPASYLFVRELHSSRAGVIAAILVSVHPALIRYSGMVRPYSFLSLLSLILVFCLWRILVREHRRNWLVGYTAVATAMIYTHHWSWLVVASGGLLWLAFGFARRGLREVGVAAVTYGVIGFLYLPWALALLRQLGGAGHLPAQESFGEAAWRALFGITWVPSGLAALLLLGISVTRFLLRSRVETTLDLRLAGGLAGGIAVLSAAMTVLLLRVANLTSLWCYSIIVPLYLVAVALIIGHRESGRRGLVAAAIQVTWVATMLLAWEKLQGIPRSNTRLVAQELRSVMNSTDRLIVVPGYVVTSFRRYLGPWERAYSLPEDTLATYIAYDHRTARDLDPRAWTRLLAAMDSSRRECSRVWFVVESGAPPHMQWLLSHVLRAARDRLGPPLRWETEPRPGMVEHSTVRRYSPCGGSPQAGDGLSGRFELQP